LPQKIKDLVISGSLTAGHARSLIDAENNVKLAATIIKKNLTVRQTENLVKSSKRKKISSNKSKDTNILDLQDKISLKTGMSVNINNSKSNRGVISFKYKSLDQLERLVKIIKSNF
jgi:ParB family chromosome partitioning protein